MKICTHKPFTTLLIKELARIIRIWPQTLLPPAITTILYFLIFGHIIGQRIGHIDHHHYSAFITPGLIMMNMITNSYVNVSSSFFSERFQRSIQAVIIAPLSHGSMMTCFVLAGVCRGLLAGSIVAIASSFFTQVTIIHPLPLMLSCLLACIMFACLGMINGLYARNFDDIGIVPTFLLTPLTYLGGVFYALSMLPAFWQKVSMFNPIVYFIHAMRYSMLNIHEFHVMKSLLIIGIFTLCLFQLTWYLVRRKSDWS